MLTRVGVLRGGPSHEYEISLATGSHVLEHLPREHYSPIDILITRDGSLHYNGAPTTLPRLSRQVDVIFNALHGDFGEDGVVQQLLHSLFIRYTGSAHLASAAGFHKVTTKRFLAGTDVKVPHYRLVAIQQSPGQAAREIFQTLCPPWIIKPARGGSSVGLTLARTAAEVEAGINHARGYGEQVLVEEYKRGREVTVGVIDNFRHRDYYPLLPIEVRKPATSIYDFDHKYNHDEYLVSPGKFSDQERAELEAAAVAVYQAIGARHYARVDLVLTSQGVYVLEINTLPALLPGSAFVRGLEAVGISFPQFLHHVVSQA